MGCAVILYLLADPLSALFISHCSEKHPPKGRKEFCIVSFGVRRNVILTLHLVILYLFHSQKFWALFTSSFNFAVMWLTGFIL